MRIEKGKYYRLQIPSIGMDSIFFIDKNFPLEKVQEAINIGGVIAKRATIQEKEYAFFMYDRTGLTGACIKGIELFFEYKKAGGLDNLSN